METMMTRVTLTSFAAGLVFACAIVAAPVNAQSTQTWVSGLGSDANPCSRAAPCLTFAGAISKTDAGGEISVLDPGGFGVVTITKSISIVNDQGGVAGILASGTNGIIVNVGTDDVVQIRGVVIDGAPPSSPGLNGVRFIGGGTLHIQSCVVKNFTSAGTNGFGIQFAPNAAAQLLVSDTTLVNNGSGSAGGGILVKPTGSASSKITLTRVNAEHNASGFTVDGTASTGQSFLIARDSVASNNTLIGFSTVSPGGGLALIEMDRSASIQNGIGVRAAGANASIGMTASTIGNNAGAGLTVSGGGTIYSYQNNFVNGNSPDGAPTGMFTPK